VFTGQENGENIALFLKRKIFFTCGGVTLYKSMFVKKFKRFHQFHTWLAPNQNGAMYW
jgi:hypothetical protein